MEYATRVRPPPAEQHAVPADRTVALEVTMLSWISVDDISVERDGRATRRVLVAGDGCLGRECIGGGGKAKADGGRVKRESFQSLPGVRSPAAERAKAEEKVLKILEKAEVDFVVLARFMKILSPNFVWRFKNKIINIHPSLLPSFPGPQPYRQAYEHGVKIAGVTAHFVSMHLDEGPIIAQESFRIKPGMTLKQIVATGQPLEAKAMVNGIRLYLTRQLDVHWGVVKQV